jgi:MFS family permease
MLVALRFIQGVAIGGEWAGAVLLAMEHGNPRKRGLNASWTQVGPSFGILIGTGFIALVTALVSPDDFLDWGWRVPFAFSLLLVAFGLWVRRGVGETPAFKQLSESDSIVKSPIVEVLRDHWRRLLVAGGARMGVGVLYALAVIFSLTYITTTLELSRTVALVAVMIGTFFNALAVPLFGALSDRFGRRPVSAAGAIAGAIWAFAFFNLLDSKQPALIVVGVVIGLVIHAAMYGPQASFITEQFPTRVRYAGSSLAYTLAGVASDAFAPLIIVSLFKATQTAAAISLYVCVTLGITLLALFCARETARLPLED